MTFPRNAIMIARAVVEGEAEQETIGKIMEVACNRKATRFWLWSGHYYRTATGEHRAVKRCREIGREEAVQRAERLDLVSGEAGH